MGNRFALCFSNISEKPLYHAGKLLTGTEMSRDKMTSVATKLESAPPKSRELLTSVTTPEDRTRPSIASTDMGCDVRMVGILCARTNDLSIKQVDAPESSKA